MVEDTKFSLYSILLCTVLSLLPILQRNGSRKKQDRGENIAAATARRCSNVKKRTSTWHGANTKFLSAFCCTFARPFLGSGDMLRKYFQLLELKEVYPSAVAFLQVFVLYVIKHAQKMCRTKMHEINYTHQFCNINLVVSISFSTFL